MLKRLLLFLLLATGASVAQGAQRIAQATVNDNGFVKVVSGATVTVCSYPTCGPINLYSEVTLSVAIPNPFTADANGNYFYYTAPGTYIETVFSPGIVTSTNVVTLGGGGASSEAFYQHNGATIGQEPALNFQDNGSVAFSLVNILGTKVTVQATAVGGVTGSNLTLNTPILGAGGSGIKIDPVATTDGAGHWTFAGITDIAMGGGTFCVHSVDGVLGPTSGDCGSSGGGVTTVTATGPLFSTLGTAPNISLQNSAAVNVTAALGTDTEYFTASGFAAGSGRVIVGDAQGGIMDSGVLLSSLQSATITAVSPIAITSGINPVISLLNGAIPTPQNVTVAYGNDTAYWTGSAFSAAPGEIIEVDIHGGISNSTIQLQTVAQVSGVPAVGAIAAFQPAAVTNGLLAAATAAQIAAPFGCPGVKGYLFGGSGGAGCDSGSGGGNPGYFWNITFPGNTYTIQAADFATATQYGKLLSCPGISCAYTLPASGLLPANGSTVRVRYTGTGGLALAPGSGTTINLGSSIFLGPLDEAEIVWDSTQNTFTTEVYHTQPQTIAYGGTGQITAQAAFNALAPLATRAGDLIWWNGTTWINIAGNNLGTRWLQEDSGGNPSFTVPSGTGDSITSPNNTITVGGTTVATTLDVVGAAGKILAGATPALTYTPALGVDGSSAGTLQLANGSAAFHTIIGTQATANWTFNLPINAGTSAQVLQTDGGGNTSWVTLSGTVTHTGALTLNHLVLGNGTADIKVDTVGLTDGAGNLSVASITDTGLGGGGPFCVHATAGLLSVTASDCGISGSGVTGVTAVFPVASTMGTAPVISLQNSALVNVTAALGTDTKYPTASGSAFVSGDVAVGDAQGGITDSGTLLSTLPPGYYWNITFPGNTYTISASDFSTQHQYGKLLSCPGISCSYTLPAFGLTPANGSFLRVRYTGTGGLTLLPGSGTSINLGSSIIIGPLDEVEVAWDSVQTTYSTEIYHTLPQTIAYGGTGQITKQAAFDALAPTATRSGDMIYWNGSHWVNVPGNNSGTQCLQETSLGAPSWAACGSGGGGDTITSPHSTLVVGGTSTNTTLDVAGAVGKILAGVTPALTYTPALGVDGSSAGTLQLANGSAAFHTIIGTQATANWTFNLPINAGTSAQVLQTDGSGNTSWVTPSGGGGGTGNYRQNFVSVTTVTMPGLSHLFGTASLLVDCYDNASPPNWMPSAYTINQSTYDVIVTFTSAQTGYCVINGGSGSGGGGGGTIIASPQFRVPYYSAAGAATTLSGDAGISTDGAGHIVLTGNPASTADIAYQPQAFPTVPSLPFNTTVWTPAAITLSAGTAAAPITSSVPLISCGMHANINYSGGIDVGSPACIKAIIYADAGAGGGDSNPAAIMGVGVTNGYVTGAPGELGAFGIAGYGVLADSNSNDTVWAGFFQTWDQGNPGNVAGMEIDNYVSNNPGGGRRTAQVRGLILAEYGPGGSGQAAGVIDQDWGMQNVNYGVGYVYSTGIGTCGTNCYGFQVQSGGATNDAKTTLFSVSGSNSYKSGIDLTGSTFSNGPIRIPNNEAIVGRNFNNTADVQMISVSGAPNSAVIINGNVQIDSLGGISTNGTYYQGGNPGFTGTKTAGSCVLTISGGIITNVTGC